MIIPYIVSAIFFPDEESIPIHTRSEVIRRLALLRKSNQRRASLDEIIVKGRVQIQNISREFPNLRFKELLIPRLEDTKQHLKGVRAHRIFHIEPELLYYLFYHSKPLPSGTVFNTKELGLEEADKALLHDPNVADSLYAGTLPRPEEAMPPSPQFVLCLDRVIFPDNVGSLIRSASGIGGVSAVLGTLGTCDFHGWKVLESTGGHGFGIPKKNGLSYTDVIAYARANRLLPIVGHSTAGVDPKEIRLTGSDHKGVMVIVGNEKHGPSQELLDVSVQARIPINDRMNSLNVGVAGGILLQIANSIQNR